MEYDSSVQRQKRKIVCAFGLFISLYALYVEYRMDMNVGYRPLCDIAQHVSCSRAFRSPFAEGLGATAHIVGSDSLFTQKNPVYGCIAYSLMMLLQFSSGHFASKMSLYLAILMNALSVYLLLILVYLRTVCVVCVAIYIVNASLLYLCWPKRTTFTEKPTSKRS